MWRCRNARERGISRGIGRRSPGCQEQQCPRVAIGRRKGRIQGVRGRRRVRRGKCGGCGTGGSVVGWTPQTPVGAGGISRGTGGPGKWKRDQGHEQNREFD